MQLDRGNVASKSSQTHMDIQRRKKAITGWQNQLGRTWYCSFTPKQSFFTSTCLNTNHISEEKLRRILLVVPMCVINPLSQQLNGRLRSILLLGRHIEIINKHYTLLAHWRTIHTLTTPAEIRRKQDSSQLLVPMATDNIDIQFFMRWTHDHRMYMDYCKSEQLYRTCWVNS